MGCNSLLTRRWLRIETKRWIIEQATCLPLLRVSFINMANDKDRFTALVPLFRMAIIDSLKQSNPDGKYIPSTASLRAAAFKAMKEIVESEAEPVGPMLAVNVWNAVMLTNESAFHQGLKRSIDNKEVTGLTLVAGAKAVAAGYFD